MRRPSPPPLKFLAAAATTTMSSRPTYRGGRSQWRRGFSDRPYPGRGGRGQGQGQFVTGDSHFRSVRDANLGFRQGDSGTFANQIAFRPSPYTQNAQFRQPPPSYNYNYNYNNQRPQFRHPPPFDQTQAFRPRPPKPLDYRNWEYAKTEIPSNCERFTVLSYNILAEYLANSHRSKLYFHIPPHMLDWKWRKRSILFELGLWSTDIMCFQEVDRFQDLEEELKLRGYSGIWKMRTGIPVDGCAIFWRTSRFKLLHEECIEFKTLELRDNVAQICVLELMNQSCTNETAALPTSSTGSNKVVICNIHVLYNPKRGDIKLGQVRVLLDRAYAVSKLWNDAPVILCGDFNCTPKSPLYKFISEQKIDLSGLDRDKLSGQAAAEICAAKPYNPNPGAWSANNTIQASSMVDGREIGIKPSNSISDMQESNNPDSDVQNLPAIKNVSPPQCTNIVLDVSDESCTNVQCGKDKGVLHDEVKKESEDTAIDGFKESIESASCVPTVGFGGDSSTSYSEGGCPVDLNEIHKYIPPVASDPEEVYSDATYTGYREKADAPSHSNNGSLWIDPESVNVFNSEILSSEPSCLTSFSNAVEVSPLGNSRNLSSQQIATDENGSSSSQYQVNNSCASTSIDFTVDEKLENLSINEHDESTTEGGPKGEDDSTFLSALHDTEDAFPYKVEDDVSPGLDSEPVDMEKTPYDPSLWTPMEIEIATGNADCTLLEHPLTLHSTYTEVQDCSGTRDSNGEPLVTSYNRCFFGTVDYIWHSEGLQTVRVLAPIPKHAMQWTPGFPTKKWGSDHIALASEFALVKGTSNHNTEVR